jgi:alkylation response protein AidB-like acyl-CoA dehydrogenase
MVNMVVLTMASAKCHGVHSVPIGGTSFPELILEHGTAAQKERWLAPLASGEIRDTPGFERVADGADEVHISNVAKRILERYAKP